MVPRPYPWAAFPPPVGISGLRRRSGCGTEGENPALGSQPASLEASTRGSFGGRVAKHEANVRAFSFFPDSRER